MKLLVVELITSVLSLASVWQISGAVDLGSVIVNANVGFQLPEKYNMTEKDVVATNNGVSRMEYLRRFMNTGIDRMPVLDPYRKDLLEPVIFSQNNSDLSGIINLRNLVAAGAKQFSLRNLEIRVQNNRIDFEIYVPRVDADVDIDAQNFIYKNFEMDFAGHLKVELKGFLVTGAISVIINLAADNRDEVLSIGGLNVDNNIDDVLVELTQHSSIRTIPQNLVPEIIEQVAYSIALTAVEELDNVLQGLNHQQLLDFLQIKDN